ncbi:MAG: hypothetical protein HGA85_09020 [Nanoarchaeota archaeon]|nr:hypothetical protein [Nanoarchaeota archaeon]
MHRYRKQNVVYKGLRFSSDLVEHVFKDRKWLLASIIAGLFGIFVAMVYKRLFFSLFFIGLGSISMVYQRYFKYSSYIGFELCMLGTVLAGLRYGSHYGVFVGAASIIGAFALSGNIKPSSFVSVLTLPLIGAITPLLSDIPIVHLGVFMTILYDAIILPLYVLLGSRIVSSLVFFCTHVLMNYWVFTNIAPIILRFM